MSSGTWFPLILLFVGVSTGRQYGGNTHKTREFIMDSEIDDYPEPQEMDAIDRIGELLPENGNRVADKSKQQQSFKSERTTNMAVELKKRISRFVLDPHTKRFSELLAGFGSIPNLFLSRNRELFYNTQRMRSPFSIRRDFQDGDYRYSHLPSPGKKRPYHYAEPEGSEFLGGPGK